MRKILLALVALSVAAPAVAQVRVRGYVRSDGTYVQPSVRTAPNSTRTDNWSSSPNVNPYNGRQGTVDPYKPVTPSPRSTRCTTSIYC